MPKTDLRRRTMNIRLDRRQFVKTAVLAAAVPHAPWMKKAFAASAPERSRVIVVTGTDTAKMLETGIAELGGWKTFVKPGGKVTLKPNAAWASRPEQGGNTDPVLVGACVAACRTAGAARVVVPENPCNPPEQSFTLSGILKEVEAAKGEMYAPREAAHFTRTTLPDAISLKEAEVVTDVLETDCLINMPVAKQHGGATLTLSMKNWMGSVKDRGFWHRSNLHQCIADLSTLVHPQLVIIDATRIMLNKGPRGPGDLAWPHQIILSLDPVAADAYAATLFKKTPFDIGYIKLAHEMGIGCGNLENINFVHLNA